MYENEMAVAGLPVTTGGGLIASGHLMLGVAALIVGGVLLLVLGRKRRKNDAEMVSDQ